MERVMTGFGEHRWRALAAAVAALSLYALFGELAPRVVSAYRLYRAWQHQEARIASVADWEDEHRRLAARKRLLQTRFAALYVSLPRSDHMSIILQVLQESAEAQQVDVREIRPTERTSFVTYDEWPFQVIVQGTFHQIGAFIGRIEQSPYVIKVKRIQFKRASPASASLTADLLLSVIILKEQGGQP